MDLDSNTGPTLRLGFVSATNDREIQAGSLHQPASFSNTERLALISNSNLRVDPEDGHIFEHTMSPSIQRHNADGEFYQGQLGEQPRTQPLHHQTRPLAVPGQHVIHPLAITNGSSAEAHIIPPSSEPPVAPRRQTSKGIVPVSRWLSDRSELPPTHFRRLDHPHPPGRATVAHLRPDSATTLRVALGLDRDGLASWLTQDWVLDAYVEYAVAELDERRAKETAIVAAGGAIGPPTRRVSAKYIVNNAVDALKSRSTRYINNDVDKTAWTPSDHDVRFVAQIVSSGRIHGRCWDAAGYEIQDLCAVAYRLMAWLRSVHKLSTATNKTSKWQNTDGGRWVALLDAARASRLDRLQHRSHRPAAPATPESDRRDMEMLRPSTSEQAILTQRPFPWQEVTPALISSQQASSLGQGLIPARVVVPTEEGLSAQGSPRLAVLQHAVLEPPVPVSTSSALDRPLLPSGTSLPPGASQTLARAIMPSATTPETSSSSLIQGLLVDEPLSLAANSALRDDSIMAPDTDLIPLATSPLNDQSPVSDPVEPDDEPSTFYTPRSSFSLSNEVQSSTQGNVTDEGYTNSLSRVRESKISSRARPKLPIYSVKHSKKVTGRIRAWDWMAPSAASSFKIQQDILLASYGVTAEWSSSCVLVPQTLSASNPMDLLYGLGPDTCPPDDAPRLMYQMLDHSTVWARAVAWFAAWPDTSRTGMELDNFLGCGPFQPREGSHLCHHGHCINPTHIVFEYSSINYSRYLCRLKAQTLRELRDEHGPHIEIPEYCINHNPPCLLQLAALTTFETYLVQASVLRIAKGILAVIPTRPDHHPFATFEHQLPLSFSTHPTRPLHLIDNGCIPAQRMVESPTFQCFSCGPSVSRKSIIGIWSHIRDKHGSIDKEQRLEAIKQSARVWQDHLEYARSQGHGISLNDPTKAKLKQVEADNFDWEVVRSWNLRYSFER